MIVKEIDDLKEIDKVMRDPEIQSRVNENNIDFELPTENTRYIAGYHKGELIGVMVYYKRKKYTTCHIQVIKTHRAALAVTFGRMALKLSESKTLYTNIPEKFKDVQRFAKHFDFKLVGTKDDSLIYKRG